MRNAIVGLCLSVALAPVPASPQAAPPPDRELTMGIQQVEQGDLEAAVLTLDGVVRRLAVAPGQAGTLARAYTYLAVAYLGLAQEQQARAKVMEAWKADPKMTMSDREFPPRVVQFFAETLKAAGKTLPPPSPKPAATPPAKKGGGSKLLLIGLGVAAAGGVAVAASSSGGGDSGPPPTTLPRLPDLTGRWLGQGANGFIFVGGPCTEQQEVDMRLTQAAGGAISGTISVVVVRVGGPPGCPGPDRVGASETVPGVTGTVRADNTVTIALPNRFTLQGTVQGTRMSGDITGLGPTTGTWVVIRQ